MIRRVLLRLLLVSLSVSFLIASSVGAACYLAVSSPTFYARLVGQHVGGDSAAEERFEHLLADMQSWQKRSLLLQYANTQQDASLPDEWFRAADIQPNPDYDPRRDVYLVKVEQSDLNALLAADDFQISGGQLTDARVDLHDGRFLVGCTLASPVGPVVLSGEFVPLSPRRDTLRLRLESIAIGRLPLPLKTLSRWLPKDESRLSGKLFLDTTGPTPVLVLSLPSDREESPQAQSIECLDGRLVVRITPAVLPRD